ncbi:MAG: hypothetical protein KKI09_05385 [Spirochaetes bacterium]|nr:hypothetical protein [Spirochaetota bacterium]MBU0954846.1 hypothetical protein [Spirochaetota bacterium]
MVDSTIFVIKGGKTAFLYPFDADPTVFNRLDTMQLEGRCGINPESDTALELRDSIYKQADRALRHFLTSKGYYLRLGIATGLFVGVFLFFSIVIRDPLPIIDEILLALLASLSYYLLAERRILTSSNGHAAFAGLRQRIDSAFFRESRIVSIIETWREEFILLGPGSFYRREDQERQYALMDDDIAEAEALCVHFASRWRNSSLVRELYESMQTGKTPGRLLDRLVKKFGTDEAALVLSYMKLLQALERRRVSL